MEKRRETRGNRDFSSRSVLPQTCTSRLRKTSLKQLPFLLWQHRLLLVSVRRRAWLLSLILLYPEPKLKALELCEIVPVAGRLSTKAVPSALLVGRLDTPSNVRQGEVAAAARHVDRDLL